MLNVSPPAVMLPPSVTVPEVPANTAVSFPELLQATPLVPFHQFCPDVFQVPVPPTVPLAAGATPDHVTADWARAGHAAPATSRTASMPVKPTARLEHDMATTASVRKKDFMFASSIRRVRRSKNKHPAAF